MVEMKSTEALEVGDVVTWDDLEGTVRQTGLGARGWMLKIEDNHTGELHVMDVDPLDAEVPIWETRYPRP